MDQLIDELWDDAPPPTADNQVKIYVHRLRKVIGDPDGRILVTRAPGYQILLAAGDLDAAYFDDLVVKGSRALEDGAPERASELLTEALGLWRGQPLADVPASELVRAEVSRLEQARLTAAGLRMEAELGCGRGAGAVPELRRLVAEHPLREELWGLLIRALQGAGREAEALEAYALARKAIAEELGVEPGAELRGLYQQILDGDTAGADAPRLRGPAPLVPAQLPAGISDFTGRARQVRQLCEALSAAADGDGAGGAVVVSLVVGAGGVGKTSLALHAAHLLRAKFPDGQLHAVLGGASGRPVTPADVLARFLRDLGVAAAGVPVAEEERAALLRTVLAGRRVLMVLDDARDAAQVRPLLPGCAGCAVLVTARNRLADLAGGRVVDLDEFDDNEAAALLARIVGAQRLAAEPEATRRVLAVCAGLPLAIRIVGARLAGRARWRVETLAARLADERRRLDELSTGDLAVRACFQVSFASLPADAGGAAAARAFRLLGLWQGTSISLAGAAALLGEPPEPVADALEALVDAQLLQSVSADRYHCHDLLRVYAVERAMAQDAPEVRQEAIGRLLAWYLHTVSAAAAVASPNRDRISLRPPPPGCAPLSFGEVAAAFGWCEAERANLITATAQAAALGMDEIGWQLPVAAMVFFNRRGYFDEWIVTHRSGLECARRAGDRSGEAWVLNNLGVACAYQHREDAIGYVEQALAIRRELGDQRGEAQAANNLAFIYGLLGRFDEEVGPLRDAIEIQRAAGHRYGECVALSNLAEALLELGQAEEAAGYCEQALTVASEIGEDRVAGYALCYLGRSFLDRDLPAEAIGYLEQALAIHRAIGERPGEADGLKQLGRAQFLTGQPDAARQSWTHALAIYTALGDEAQATGILGRLAELGTR